SDSRNCCLERDFHREPRIERILVRGDRLEVGVGERGLEAQVAELVNAGDRLRVSHVEQVGTRAKREALRELFGIFRMQIDSARELGRSQLAAPAKRYLARVSVGGMVGELADWGSTLDADARTQGEAL